MSTPSVPPSVNRSSEGASALASGLPPELLLRALFDDAPRGLLITHPDGVMRHCNAALAHMLGYEPSEMIGRRFNDITHPEDLEIGLQFLRDVVAGRIDHAVIEKRYLRKDGSPIWVGLSIHPVRDEAKVIQFFVTSVEDLSLRKQVEAERVAAKEQIIAAQAETLRQLSTPLIPIAAGVLALPLIGPVDSERAHLILDTLLSSVAAQGARRVLLDITGVPSVDNEVAVLLVRATQAVRLLGAEVFLTGIRAEVAQRLVSLGVDLSGMRTLGSFQSGIAMALASLGGQKPRAR